MINNRSICIFIPSAYGFVIWIVLLILLVLQIIVVEVSLYAYVIYFYVVFCLSLSFFVSFFRFKSMSFVRRRNRFNFLSYDYKIFYCSTILGLIGLCVYIYDFSLMLGGLINFSTIFFLDPLQIRALAAEESSIGFQLSYFSWVSICYCLIFILSRGDIGGSRKLLIISILIVQYSLNLLFVDRTRPVIIFLLLLMIFVYFRVGSGAGALRLISLAIIGPIVIFFVQAIFTGKYDLESGLFDNFLSYILGGFGYFSKSLNLPEYNFELIRIIYPIIKILNFIGSDFVLPSQVLDFKSVPFLTNVGTFLEPLLSDGGVIMVLIGVPLIIFAIDYLAVVSLESRSIVGLLLWANLVVVLIFSFFSPKYNSVYLYIFVLLFLFGGIAKFKLR